MKSKWLESFFNIEANHTLSFEIWKCFESILNKGKVMPIKGTFGIFKLAFLFSVQNLETLLLELPGQIWKHKKNLF